MATPTPTPTPDEGWNPIGGLIDGATDVIDGVNSAVGFWSDPFGNMYKAARDAVDGLTTDFLPALTGATLPDLSSRAFLETYKVSFALSLFVAVVLLVVQLLRTAKGTQSGRDTLHAIGLYFPGFILGVMFGPLIGIMIVNFVHALSKSLLEWAYGGTAEQLAADLTRVLIEDPAMFAGGVYIAWMIAWAMAIGLLFVVILFVVQLVTLYFSGALIPLASVWVIDPTRRGAGLRAVGVWVGILLTHPLLFLLLGLAFRLIGNTIDSWGSDGWKNLISLLVAVMAMWAAALSPFFLLRYVKSISGAGSPSGSGGSAPRIGSPSPSQLSSSAPRGSTPATPATSSSAAAQAVRGSAAPVGPTLGQAAATRSSAGTAAAGSGRVVTAGAGGAARAGMATRAVGGAAGAVATSAVTKGYQGAKEAAETSVAPPPRESYGKDRL